MTTTNHEKLPDSARLDRLEAALVEHALELTKPQYRGTISPDSRTLRELIVEVLGADATLPFDVEES